MGTQQLLLLVLVVMIVGVAIVIGINLFAANAIGHKRDVVAHECVSLASMAQQYYRKPTAMGGGERSFTGWEIPSTLVSTENGSFQADVSANQVIITGTGNEIVTGNDSVKVEVTVLADRYETRVIN